MQKVDRVTFGSILEKKLPRQTTNHAQSTQVHAKSPLTGQSFLPSDVNPTTGDVQFESLLSSGSSFDYSIDYTRALDNPYNPIGDTNHLTKKDFIRSVHVW